MAIPIPASRRRYFPISPGEPDPIARSQTFPSLGTRSTVTVTSLRSSDTGLTSECQQQVLLDNFTSLEPLVERCVTDTLRDTLRTWLGKWKSEGKSGIPEFSAVLLGTLDASLAGCGKTMFSVKLSLRPSRVPSHGC